MWFIGVEVEQETSAPPPKKNPGSAPDTALTLMNAQTRSWFISVDVASVKFRLCCSCSALSACFPLA